MKSTSAGTFFAMSSLERNLRILATLAALFVLALAAGCRGFFVNPTLTSINVVPTSATIIEGGTQQINATGNFNDGSTKDLTGSASWTSSATDIATVSKGGLVTAASTISSPPGTAIITATSGTITASPSARHSFVPPPQRRWMIRLAVRVAASFDTGLRS